MAEVDIAGVVLGIPSWTPYAAVAVSGVMGATYAAKRGFDVVGVFGLSFVTGLGGLLLRDIFLADVTAMFQEPWYLLVAFWTSIVGFFFAGLISRFTSLMVVLDGLAMGFLCSVGAEGAIAHGLPWSSAILMGVVTATGGLILRDVLAGTAPEVVRPGVFLAIPAFVSSAVFVGMSQWQFNPVVAQIAAMIVALFLRAGAHWFNWHTASAADLSDRVWSYWYRSQQRVKKLTVHETTEYFTDTAAIPTIPVSDKPAGQGSPDDR